MHLPGFTAELALRNVDRPYQDAGSSSARQRGEGVVMPAWTACQLQCRMDEAELFYDCIIGCGGNMICDYRCQLARAVYIARCDASCKAGLL
jgi:hypothetical protein